MSTATTWKTNSVSADQTERLAEKIGSNLRGGEVIELVSDLGGGKTTFTRGLARGVGSSDQVGSPTFTLSKEYVGPHFTIVHFDFYRLNEAGIVADELAEVEGDAEYVVVVEWGEIVHDVLPQKRMTIELVFAGEETRTIVVTYPPELQYLIEGVE